MGRCESDNICLGRGEDRGIRLERNEVACFIPIFINHELPSTLMPKKQSQRNVRTIFFTNRLSGVWSSVGTVRSFRPYELFALFFNLFPYFHFFEHSRRDGRCRQNIVKPRVKRINWNLARSYEAWPSRSAAWLTRAGRPTQPAWTLLARGRRAWRRQARARPRPRSARSPRPRSARSRWRGAHRCGRPAGRKVCKCAMRTG